MIKKFLILITLSSIQLIANAQTEIVKWTFPTGQPVDTIQNSSNTLNIQSVIRSVGTSAIYMTNGQVSGDYAATATGWDNGANLKYWYVTFKTTGYNTIKISSKQRVGGNNGGPLDHKMQYKIGIDGTWTDILGGTITTGNNWTTGVITNLDLPSDCQNQSELIYVRWIMTSNNDINSGFVASTGISKIDDIIVTGSLLTSIEGIKESEIFSVINTAKGVISINSFIDNATVSIYNTSGRIVLKQKQSIGTFSIDSYDLTPGIYLIQVKNASKSLTKKVFLQ
jgi:hypothetical protein